MYPDPLKCCEMDGGIGHSPAKQLKYGKDVKEDMSKELSPVSILYKSIAGRYWPVRVADGPITARYRFIKNASWEVEASTKWVNMQVELF